MPEQEIPPSIHSFLSRHVRTVEQLEILLLLRREPDTTWSVEQVYDAILSTPQSVERWLTELARNGLIEKVAGPSAGYRCTTEEGLMAEMLALGEFYRTRPVRVIEAIYRRETGAAQSFADAFKIKKTDQNS